MSSSMKLLLTRATPAVALLMFVAVGIGHPIERHPALAAQRPAVAIVHDPAPAPLSDHVLLRQIAIERATPAPTPTPTPRRLVVAARPTSRPAPPAPPARASSGAGQFRLINQDRAAAGLAPLQWSDCLANVATGQAARMAAQGFISHANGVTLDLGCHLGMRSGENIGYVGGGIDDASMNAWFMGDAPHRANILGPYHYVGAAWVIAPNGAAYLAVEFG